MTISGLAICFFTNPWYAFCLVAYLPFLTIVMNRFSKVIIRGVKQKMQMNAKLGAFTEEMLSSLKLIISFGQEEKKLAEYVELATQTQR